MTGQQIIDSTKELQLPIGEFVVFGSCPMALAGIRESDDIDIFVSQALYDELKQKGWSEQANEQGVVGLVSGHFDVHKQWEFGAYSPTLRDVLANAKQVDGVPFAALDDVIKWKQILARPKDLRDVALIEQYLAC
jgi:hypothetical protein